MVALGLAEGAPVTAALGVTEGALVTAALGVGWLVGWLAPPVPSSVGGVRPVGAADEAALVG